MARVQMARVRDKVIDTLWLLFLPLKQAQLPSSSQVPPLPLLLSPFLLLSVFLGPPHYPVLPLFHAHCCPALRADLLQNLGPRGPWAHLTLVLAQSGLCHVAPA